LMPTPRKVLFYFPALYFLKVNAASLRGSGLVSTALIKLTPITYSYSTYSALLYIIFTCTPFSSSAYVFMHSVLLLE
jgi:hypothetical protein